MSTLLTTLLAALALLAPTQTTTPAPPAPVSVAQLCAATGVEQLDGLLDQVADSALVGALAPLASLTVPDTAGVKLDVGVDLAAVRAALDCAPAATTAPTTPPTTAPTTPPATPTTTPRPPVYYADCAAVRAAGAAPLLVSSPGYRAGLDSDHDGIACENPDIDNDGFTQVDEVPVGAAETGDGSLAG